MQPRCFVNRLTSLIILLTLLFILPGCSRWKMSTLFSKEPPLPPVLKVGIAADSPPLIFKKDGAITGLETGFAAGLARSMGRQAELIELSRAELGKALLEKKIDIIMAGVTANYANTAALAASSPYLLSGQAALVHLDDIKLGANPQAMAQKQIRLGVVARTAGDSYAATLKPQGKVSRFPSAQEGVQALINDAIDVLLNDMPATCYYASQHVEKGLTPGAKLLTSDELVWAMRPDDATMQKAANAYLEGIDKSGELQEMIKQAIPFYKATSYSPVK